MKHSDPQISEEIVSEIFALASRLCAKANQTHTQKNQNYCLTELIEAGVEAQIPPELIPQAIQEIQAKRTRTQVQQERIKVILATTGLAIALWGM